LCPGHSAERTGTFRAAVLGDGSYVSRGWWSRVWDRFLAALILPCVSRCPHTAKAHVRHAGVRAASVAGAGSVTGAITIATEEGTSFLSPQRSVRLAGIEAPGRACGVDDHPFAGSLAVQVDLVPVAAPLPDVASHVVQAVAVGREGLHR